MPYQQDATFRISGRITTKRDLTASTQIGISVQRREPDPKSPRGWKPGRIDHFVLNIANAAMRSYVQSLDVDDLVVAEGDLVTTSFTPDGSTRPVNATKMSVFRLSGMPRAQADRIDREIDAGATPPDRPPF